MQPLLTQQQCAEMLALSKTAMRPTAPAWSRAVSKSRGVVALPLSTRVAGLMLRLSAHLLVCATSMLNSMLRTPGIVPN